MPMSDQEREELMERVMEEPLPPMQELMDKWIKPSPAMEKWLNDALPEGIRNEPGEKIVGPELIDDPDAEGAVTVELDQESKDAIKRRVLERGSENLQARVAAAAAALDRKGEG